MHRTYESFEDPAATVNSDCDLACGTKPSAQHQDAMSACRHEAGSSWEGRVAGTRPCLRARLFGADRPDLFQQVRVVLSVCLQRVRYRVQSRLERGGLGGNQDGGQCEVRL